MGQQQLLLILLGVIIVAIALSVGLTLFQDSAVSANRDAVSNDLVALAARAQTYYRKPTSFGGGQNSFTGLAIDKLTTKPVNANGTYEITTVTSGQVVLTGTGVEIGDDGNNLIVTITVFPDSTFMVSNN